MSDKPYHMHPYIVYLLIIGTALFILWCMSDDIQASHRMRESVDQTLVQVERIVNSLQMEIESSNGTMSVISKEVQNNRETLALMNKSIQEIDPMYSWRLAIHKKIADLEEALENASQRP